MPSADTLAHTAPDASAAGSAAGAPAQAVAPEAAPDKPTPEQQAEKLRAQRLMLLMMRIDENPDFATTKQSVLGLQKVSRSERAHARALVDLIHDDAAMASKLLRLVNAAYYSSVGGGQITNLQRAVALMGFTGIGMLTSSLVIFERLPKGADGDRLRREFARAQLAAILAHEFCHDRTYFDSVYIAALFQRLGELLGGLHLSDELKVIDDTLEDREMAPGTAAYNEARTRMIREQWGVSLEDLAIEVAGRWGWPSLMQVAMRPLAVTDPEQEVAGDEYFRMLCTAANTLAEDTMRLKTDGTPEEQAEARGRLAARFGEGHAQVLGLNPEALAEQLERGRATWLDLMGALGMSVAEVAEGASSTPKKKVVKPNTQENRRELAQNLADMVERLTRLNQKSAPAAEVIDTTLRLLHEKLDLQRVIVCLRDEGSGRLLGHQGIGERAVVLTRYFDVPLQPPSCLFGLLCLKNADTLISDTTDAVVGKRLPEWFHRKVKAGSFVLLPLVHNGNVLGMIYGDQPEPNQLHVHDRALALLKELRLQVARAMQAKPAEA
jgi:HD-like signal output (HDOD) protein